MKITVINKSDEKLSYQSRALRLSIPSDDQSVHEIPEGCFEDLKARLAAINPMITIVKGEPKPAADKAEPAAGPVKAQGAKAQSKPAAKDSTENKVEA